MTDIEILADIINRGRGFCGVPRLSENQVKATAEEWDDFLIANGVPPQQYHNCFKEFMRGEKQTKFTVYELRAAWLRIAPKEKPSEVITELDAKCGGCSGTGWALKELVEAAGKKFWQAIRMSPGCGAYSAVKPCICSKGKKIERAFKLAAADNHKLWEKNGWLEESQI
jgi:hypothetical protein